MSDSTKYPEKGDKMYVNSSCYMSRGADDFAGGIATVKKMVLSDYLPKGHFNYAMIVFDERPHVQYNYQSLLERQDKLKEEFGNAIAHPDPDYRDEFNDEHSGWSEVFL